MTQTEKLDIMVRQGLHAIRVSGDGPVEDNMKTMLRHGLALIAMTEAVEAVHDALHTFAAHFTEEYGVFWQSDAEAMNLALDSMLENLPEDIAEALVERFFLIPANDRELRHAS